MAVPRPAPPPFSNRLFTLLAGELVSKGSIVVAFVWLARQLDPAVYGEVEWALSVLMVVTLAADAGLQTWAAAETAAAPGSVPGLVARVAGLRIALALPAYALVLIVAWHAGGTAGRALAIYGLVLLLTPLFLQYLFNGLFQPRWAALGNALRGLTFAAVVFLVVRPGSSPSAVAMAEVLGAAALALTSVVVLRAKLGLSVRWSEGLRGASALFARSWRTGASELTWGVQWYAGLILLGYLASTTEVAWHSSSLRLVLALHTFVWLYLYVLLPGLARVITRDPGAWARTCERSLRVTAWMGLLIAVVGTLGAKPILTTVFGTPFAAAVPVLQAMVWVIPIAWMSGHWRYSFIAIQRPDRDYQAALVGAAATIGLTAWLTPLLAAVGASAALVGGSLANAVAAGLMARGLLPRLALTRSLAPGVLCAAGCLVLGRAMAPVTGDLTATAAAGVVMVACGASTERTVIAEVLRTGLAALRPAAPPAAKAEDLT